MADSENTTPRSSFGWLPKLILWGVVLTFGYLYLNSLDQQGGDSSHSLLERISQLSPIPISALPGTAPKAPPATETHAAESPAHPNPVAEPVAAKSADAVRTQDKTTPAPNPHPVNETESTVFANSLMNGERMARPVAGQPAAVTPPSAPVAEQQAPVATTAPLAPAARQSAPSASVPSLRAAVPEAAAAPVQPVPYDRDWESVARVLARYEAMRREADERMRQYWEGMRNSAPVAGPYGYPGYPAGYGPGPGAVAP